MTTLYSLAWLAYRRLRALEYSILGRNPLCRGKGALGLAEEWASVRGLLLAKQSPSTILETDAEGHTLWKTAAGSFWTPRGADSHFVGMLAAEILANVYSIGGVETLGSSSVVLDCGANVGCFSRHALNKGAGLVVAFEPSPETALCLRRNLAPEIESGRAVVIQKGLWDSETTLSFRADNKSNPGSHHVMEGPPGDTSISVTTIDEVVKALALPKTSYIKMDIEGSELRAIQGGQNTIRQHRPVVSIATEHTDDLFANAVAVLEAMRSLNPSYGYVCTEAHVYKSPSRGKLLTPYALLFSVT
jgi:FkbM family methyltransferase